MNYKVKVNILLGPMGVHLMGLLVLSIQDSIWRTCLWKKELNIHLPKGEGGPPNLFSLQITFVFSFTCRQAFYPFVTGLGGEFHLHFWIFIKFCIKRVFQDCMTWCMSVMIRRRVSRLIFSFSNPKKCFVKPQSKQNWWCMTCFAI